MHHANKPCQESLPFLESLLGYANSGVSPFHTPGHKQGRGAHDTLQRALPDSLRLDVSDVVASPLFNDSWPDALRAAENLAAQVFGAQETRFVVNGTTGAIHAMLLATRMLGFTHVVLPREAHLSVFAGLVLADLEPIYVANPVLRGWNLLLPPSAVQYPAGSSLKKTAWFATHPSYYGIAQPLDDVAHGAQTMGGLLLVDEAHGPHYGFHPHLPKPALACGAHLVAQSTHKILGALTQASMLHVGSIALPQDILHRSLLLTQSTSPSGLLLASLDAARAQMAQAGNVLWGRALEMAADLRGYITSNLGMAVLADTDLPEGYTLDATRLTIRTSDRGVHGVEAAKLLRHYGVQVEMADPWHVVAIITWADSAETLRAFRIALGQAVGGERGAKGRGHASAKLAPDPLWHMPTPTARLSPRVAALAPSEAVPLASALGRVSAEAVCPYPPGVPAICPGEEIDHATLSYLEEIRHRAFEVRGASDPSLRYLHVVR